MKARLFWLLATAVVFVAILAFPTQSGPTMAWVYGASYFLLGVGLLGTIARGWVRGTPALWRPLMLSIGSLVAALEIWFHPDRITAQPVDRWMLALLGLLAAAILARLVPERLSHAWLGVERRVRDQGA